jgi:hypothetical protein
MTPEEQVTQDKQNLRRIAKELQEIYERYNTLSDAQFNGFLAHRHLENMIMLPVSIMKFDLKKTG